MKSDGNMHLWLNVVQVAELVWGELLGQLCWKKKEEDSMWNILMEPQW